MRESANFRNFLDTLRPLSQVSHMLPTTTATTWRTTLCGCKRYASRTYLEKKRSDLPRNPECEGLGPSLFGELHTTCEMNTMSMNNRSVTSLGNVLKQVHGIVPRSHFFRQLEGTPCHKRTFLLEGSVFTPNKIKQRTWEPARKCCQEPYTPEESHEFPRSKQRDE